MTHQDTRATTTGSAPTSGPAFVGRDRELATIVDALTAPPALVLVEGEAGIGKTRLLREALASPAVARERVLVTACPALTDPFSLGGVVEGLRRFVRTSDVRMAGLGLSALGGALRPLFPEWANELPAALEALDDAKETRHRLLRALTELIERLDVDILVVEDAHWADAATLEWLLTLTAGEPATDWTPSVVVSYRPTEVPEGSLLLRLTSRPTAGMGRVRVELQPLDAQHTRRLVASMFHTGEVSEEFARFLHDHTDGVPLAVEESVRLLRDRKDIVRTDHQWSRRAVENLEVPPTVRDSVLERVHRLHPDVRAILHAGAVLAHPSDEHLLATVAGLDESTGRVALTAALTSGLLQETDPGRFVFRHALDAQAVEQDIPASQWRSIHRRAADALRTVEPAPVVRLARHYREAGDTEAWCHYAEPVADLARESGDDRTAVVVLHEVLTGAEHPSERRARLARKLGEAACFGGSAVGHVAEQVPDTLRDVLADGSLPQAERGVVRLLLGRLLYGRDTEAAVEVIEAALPDLADEPAQAARAMMSLAMPLTPDWPVARHLEWLERATELLPRVDSESERLAFVVNQATALLLLGQEGGWQVAAELPHTASSALDLNNIAYGMLHVGQAAIIWGRCAEARSRLALATEIGHAADYQLVINTARVAQAFLDWYTGAWDSLAHTAAQLAEAEESDADARLEATVVQGLVEIASGHRRSAEQRLRAVGEEFARWGLVEPQAVPQVAALGRLHVTDGEMAEALHVTAPVVDMIERKGVWIWAADVAPVHLDALIGAGQLDRAEQLVREFANGLSGRDAPAPAAALTVCQAILAETESNHGQAAHLFAEAAAAWAALPRRYDELLALERQGLSLLAADRRVKALELLSDVQQRLRALGAKWDADRVARLLRNHGMEVPHAWRGGRHGYGDQLSPRELEVVDLVARGMTNKEVAKALFISPRTVNRHLMSAMRKLSVSSRTALAMAATESGLLPPDTG